MLVVTMRCALLKLWSISVELSGRSPGCSVRTTFAQTLKSEGNGLLKLLELFGEREVPRRDGTRARHLEWPFVYGVCQQADLGVGKLC
jgi:hypothetical protein